MIQTWKYMSWEHNYPSATCKYSQIYVLNYSQDSKFGQFLVLLDYFNISMWIGISDYNNSSMYFRQEFSSYEIIKIIWIHTKIKWLTSY